MAIVDRAVFLEKGTVRFDGAARELVERATTWPVLCSGRSLVDLPLFYLAGRGRRRDQRPRLRVDRHHRRRAGASLDAGHQLRRRQHGPPRRRAVRTARARVRRAGTGSACPRAGRAGVLFSTAAELLVVRRLFRAPRVILLVSNDRPVAAGARDQRWPCRASPTCRCATRNPGAARDVDRWHRPVGPEAHDPGHRAAGSRECSAGCSPAPRSGAR